MVSHTTLFTNLFGGAYGCWPRLEQLSGRQKMNNANKIFLAAPFQAWIDEKTGRMNLENVELINRGLGYLRSKGYEVHNAHDREKWGEDWYGPERCTPLDLERIKDSGTLVAFPGNPPSGGVHIELGWASALEKRIILLLKDDGVYSNLVLGLNTVSPVQMIWYKDINDIVSQLDSCLPGKSDQGVLTTSVFYDRMSTSYDAFMEEGESTLEDEINLVLRTFPIPCKILDVGCGTGRIAIPLQTAGYSVTGIDISSGMIGQAKEKGLRDARQVSVEEFNSSNNFAGIISLHTGFSYTDDHDGMRSALQAAYRLLNRAGKVLWDSPNQNCYGKQRILEWPSDNGIVRTICYGHDAERVKNLFVEAGFSILNIFGSYTPFTEYWEGDPRLII